MRVIDKITSYLVQKSSGRPLEDRPLEGSVGQKNERHVKKKRGTFNQDLLNRDNIWGRTPLHIISHKCVLKDLRSERFSTV